MSHEQTDPDALSSVAAGDRKGWRQTELLKFEDLDAFAWHKGFFHLEGGGFKIWRRNFNELRIRDLALFALGEIQGKSILDVGCGDGLYLLTFLRLGARPMAGQDLSEKYVSLARDYCRREGFECDLRVGDCTTLMFEDESFDCVFSGDFFEHISEIQKHKVVAEVFRVLRPGGRFVIKTPNLSYLKTVVFLKRCLALAKLKAPWNIHVAHTRNNPTCEHHGLTTHGRLEKILLDNMFHWPHTVSQELFREGLPFSIGRILKGARFTNETIIMVARKPVFYSIYK